MKCNQKNGQEQSNSCKNTEKRHPLFSCDCLSARHLFDQRCGDEQGEIQEETNRGCGDDDHGLRVVHHAVKQREDLHIIARTA